MNVLASEWMLYALIRLIILQIDFVNQGRHMPQCTQKSEDGVWELDLSFYHMRPWGLSSGCRAWWMAPLLLIHLPGSYFIFLRQTLTM